MDHGDAWKVIERKLLHDGSPWVKLFRELIALPSGRRIENFYRVQLTDFAVVFALTADEQIVMVRGYKHAVGQTTLSLPAGMIEPGEEALAAAQRELAEETGYASSHWQQIGSYVVDANRHCGQMYLFFARHAQQQQAPELDDSEMLSCELFDRAMLQHALARGELDTLPAATGAAMGLLFLDQLTP